MSPSDAKRSPGVTTTTVAPWVASRRAKRSPTPSSSPKMSQGAARSVRAWPGAVRSVLAHASTRVRRTTCRCPGASVSRGFEGSQRRSSAPDRRHRAGWNWTPVAAAPPSTADARRGTMGAAPDASQTGEVRPTRWVLQPSTTGRARRRALPHPAAVVRMAHRGHDVRPSTGAVGPGSRALAGPDLQKDAPGPPRAARRGRWRSARLAQVARPVARVGRFLRSLIHVPVTFETRGSLGRGVGRVDNLRRRVRARRPSSRSGTRARCAGAGIARRPRQLGAPRPPTRLGAGHHAERRAH